ncbi:hypothetical protein EG68_03047 [Paragonimus skrjabini miyazakii]|uniref:Uncharacterized protein n=1 Tax=Paragonimus skrjabini miyazakii TaxID=59628 RepID=A0A8S9Z261_9TREM|nr:hypothetical protein EG68_03047 [Paragonimus skrjabini miyazakii]
MTVEKSDRKYGIITLKTSKTSNQNNLIKLDTPLQNGDCCEMLQSDELIMSYCYSKVLHTSRSLSHGFLFLNRNIILDMLKE